MTKKFSFSVVTALLLVFGAGVVATYAVLSAQNTDQTPSLFGIPLVPPIFAANGNPEFPDAEAGLSAYVRLSSADISLANAADSVFTEILFAGDNYVIGNVRTRTSSRMFTPSNFNVNVRVYLDEDGLISAYFPKGAQNSLLFDWDEWDNQNPVLKTTFQEAMEAVAQAAAAESIEGKELGWYHWAYPEATHLVAAAKSITSGDALFLTLPANVTILDTPFYSYRTQRVCGVSACQNTQLFVVRSDQETIVNNSTFIAYLPLEPGFAYTLKNSSSRANDVGVVIIYKAQ